MKKTSFSGNVTFAIIISMVSAGAFLAVRGSTQPALAPAESLPANQTATPPGDPYTPRLGLLPDGRELMVTPYGTPYFFAVATPCAIWIDAAGVLFCTTKTPIPPGCSLSTQGAPGGYPGKQDVICPSTPAPGYPSP